MTRRLRGAVIVAVAATLLTSCDDQPKASGCPDAAALGPGDASGIRLVAADVEPVPVVPDRLFVSADGSEITANCWPGTCHWGADGKLDSVDPASFLAISTDGQSVARGGKGATIDVEGADGSTTYRGLHEKQITDSSSVTDVELSADGKRLAGADVSGAALIWTVGDGCPATTIDAGDAANLAFSPDGALIAITSLTVEGSGTAVYDATSGERVAALQGSTPSGAPPAWSPDGKWLAASGPDGAASIWSSADWTLEESFAGGEVRHLVFSPDSTVLAGTSHDDHHIHLWSSKAFGGDGSTRTFVGHDDDPVAVIFAGDGATLYSVAGQEGVFAWNVADAELTTRFELPEL